MEHLKLERDDAVAHMILNRPDSRNAYSDAMVQEIIATLGELERDNNVRCVILRGAGTVFSAGGDVKQIRAKSGMFAGDPMELRDNYRLGIQAITHRFDQFEKPVIACIHGAAIGAGLGLACMADIRLCAHGTKFGSTFPRLGLVPGDGTAYLLSRVVGYGRAMELLLTARVFEPEEALRIGLVSHIESLDNLLPKASEIAHQIAALPPEAIQLTKMALVRSWNENIHTATQLASSFQAIAQRSQGHEDALKK